MIDSTNVEFPQRLVDYTHPEPTGFVEDPDARAKLRALAASREFPEHWMVPRDAWKDYARENDFNLTWPENYRNRFTNQGPGDGKRGTHECTCHSLTQGFECCWNRQSAGIAAPVYVSPLSIYAEANPRQWGGATTIGVLDIATRRGFLPDHAGPNGIDEQRARFEHTLIGTCGKGNDTQSTGDWVPLRDFPDGWQETARHFRVLEAVICETVDQIVSAVLRGFVVNVGRRGHAVPYTQIVWRDGELFALYSDSYDVIRFDSMQLIGESTIGASAITAVVAPDDWTRPAGEQTLAA